MNIHNDLISFLIGVSSSLFVTFILAFLKPVFSFTFRFKDVRGVWAGCSTINGKKHVENLKIEKQFINKFWGEFHSPDRKLNKKENIVYELSGKFIDDQHAFLIYKPKKKHADSLGVSFLRFDRFENKFNGASVTLSKNEESTTTVDFKFKRIS